MIDLIPRAHLFGNPTRAAARIHPRGTHVAWLAPVDGVMNLWVAPRDDLGAGRPLTRDRHRGIADHAWARTGEHLLYLQDRDGDENDHLYAVEPATGEVRDLTPIDGVKALLIGGPRNRPDLCVVGLNDRNPQLHDLYAIDLRTGERTLLALNDLGAVGWLIDADGAPRIAMCPRADGGMTMLAARDGGWRPLLEISRDDALVSGPIQVRGTRVLWIGVGEGDDTAALWRLDLETGARERIGGSPGSDLAELILHPETDEVLAWAANRHRLEWHPLDAGVAADLAHLHEALGPGVEIVDTTRDFETWVLRQSSDLRAGVFHLYDRATRRLTELFPTRPALVGAPLAAMEPLTIRSRDGLELVSYLTRPRGASGPGPLVLYVHGGPWARDHFGFDGTHQLLANRGYRVLSVNFRGSLGFGRAFVNAGDGEWGGKMHDDLLDAVQWAIDAGEADPARVAIMGASYGGYAALWGLAGTPEVFACGVDVVGPSSLLTFIRQVPEYWKPLIDMLRMRVGDYTTEEGRARLLDRSPLARADAIVRPLLIVQGQNDPRVLKAESDQIVEALRHRDVPVTYANFPDEGHGFRRPENNLAYVAAAEAFLARWLGGRAEPAGDVVAASTMQILHGREHLPGF